MEGIGSAISKGAAKIKRRLRSEKGFTLIELLVVILILGILAAIAIPSFLSQRGKGQDAAAKEHVLSARTAMETCSTDNGGDYTNCDANAIQTIEPTLANAPAPAVDAAGAAGFTLSAASDSGVTYTLVRAGGNITRTCAPVSTGGCNAAGTW